MSEREPNGHFAQGNATGVDTKFQPGKSGNPGGQPKTRKELRLMARESMPRAFERARQILEDDSAEWRAWIEAAKFLSLYGYGAQPKSIDDEAERPERSRLTIEERRAIARMKLSSEAPPDAPGSAEH